VYRLKLLLHRTTTTSLLLLQWCCLQCCCYCYYYYYCYCYCYYYYYYCYYYCYCYCYYYYYWQVTQRDPIWQLTLRRSVMDFSIKSYTYLYSRGPCGFYLGHIKNPQCNVMWLMLEQEGSDMLSRQSSCGWVGQWMLALISSLGCILDAGLAGQCCNTVFMVYMLSKCRRLLSLKSPSPCSLVFCILAYPLPLGVRMSFMDGHLVELWKFTIDHNINDFDYQLFN